MDRQNTVTQVTKLPGLLTQRVGAEILVYNERTHRAFCLNPVAAEIWQQLEKGTPIEQIASAATLSLASPVSVEMVLFTVEELRRDGLIAPGATPVAGLAPTRRDLIRQIGAGAAVMLPAVAMIMAPKAAQAYNGCVDCTAPDPGSEDDPQKPDPQQQQAAQQPQQRSQPQQQTTRRQGPADAPILFRP